MLCRLLAGFLLVTSRRLAVLAQASTVVWNSPTPGDRFSSGNTISANGRRPKRLSHPLSGSVPPAKTIAGPRAVPDVDKESAYYLRMKDDFGHTYSSPIFTLTSYLQNENNPATVPPDVVAQPQSGSDQAPISRGTLCPESKFCRRTAPTRDLGPLVAAAHSAPPAAALAVPLSLAGAIIVLAGGLALHHRRRLVAEKERARESSHAGADDVDAEVDVEKALFARGGALFRGRGGGFFPDHTTDAYYPRVAAGAAPLYPYHGPEPRQRTRHLALDLLPALGYRRPRPPPPPLSSSSASSSLRRGYFGDVDRSRSRGSGPRNGGGSLWRSLSISRHRRKVAPPSTLTSSPSMTESVTSEVLPSYLPSPDFVDQGNRGHGTDYFEFENVPLSPPLLHTREASESEDSRMKELRGVYEAVARALGGTRVG
ncbi:hypothetical protein H4582DRAFT_2192272 [Lactarius indigo]|nr:hypothetical protein H4582DRAFT_2192272 [Lactarius indigo]